MQTDKYDKNNHQSEKEYGRTAPQMSHCGRSWVVLRGTEDLKEEEVQVHPGITNRGCLASTCRHPLTSAHKHTRTLALTSSRTQSAWANVSPLLQVNPFTRPQQLKTKFPPPAKLRPDHNWVCALNWVYWILLYCCTFIVYRVLAVQLHSVVPRVFIFLIPGDDLWNKSRLVLRNVCSSYALFMKKWGSVTAGTFAMARHSPGSATTTFTTNAFQCDPGKNIMRTKFTILSYIFITTKMGGNRAVCATVPARIVASLSVVMAALAEVTRFVSLLGRCKEWIKSDFRDSH